MVRGLKGARRWAQHVYMHDRGCLAIVDVVGT